MSDELKRWIRPEIDKAQHARDQIEEFASQGLPRRSMAMFLVLSWLTLVGVMVPLMWLIFAAESNLNFFGRTLDFSSVATFLFALFGIGIVGMVYLIGREVVGLSELNRFHWPERPS